MKFAQPEWLLGTGIALLVALLLITGGFWLVKAIRRFGDEERILALTTGRAAGRRALKGVLLVLSVAIGFVAAAQPQYGRGTRLLPATNLDTVIVLDYSKSMYARDVTPFRIARAKSEVAELIRSLPGARFGAVAFAGQPMRFPLTGDGSAIAQFFRQLSPNDMPVGGTAIARALEAGRELFERDPLSKDHRRVMVLVTDGEDLSGDPLTVARAARNAGLTIHVVQIGGRTPEPLPEVNEAGEVVGWRTNEQGTPITTSLTAEGEAQLAEIAETTGGKIVRSQQGETGIAEIAQSLRSLMNEELSEKVETVYADVYMYPLALAIFMLLAEAFIPETRTRRKQLTVPTLRKRQKRRKAGAVTVTLLLLVTACEYGIDTPFMRHAPKVDKAIEALDAGDAPDAARLLQQYLSTGECEQGQIGTPEETTQYPNASFDLGLALFRIGEQFGRRFGETDPTPEPTPSQDETGDVARSQRVECALRILQAILTRDDLDAEQFAQAHYLAGNLEFLRARYQEAIEHYESALRWIPGTPGDAGTDVGRDAAFNRALALHRLEEQEPPDAGPPDAGPPDGGPPDGGPPDAGPDGGAPDSGEPDASPDGGEQPESSPDGGPEEPDAGEQSGEEQAPDAGPPEQQPEQQPQPEPSNANQDEQVLDMLERAPTLQQHQAGRGVRRRVTGSEDK